jgi:hypothetical protein
MPWRPYPTPLSRIYPSNLLAGLRPWRSASGQGLAQALGLSTPFVRLPAPRVLRLITLVAAYVLIVLAVIAGADWVMAQPYQHRERVWDSLAQQRRLPRPWARVRA